MASTRLAYPGTISPGDPVGATNNNSLPGGCIGRDSQVTTSGFTGIGGTAVQICAVTPTVGANRYIVARAHGNVSLDSGAGSAATDNILVGIQNDAGTTIGQCWVNPRAASQKCGFAVECHEIAPSAGARQYTLVVQLSGGDTCSLVASSVGPVSLRVFDEGVSF